MIQSTLSTVLHINKFSVLLVSLLLIILWLKLDLFETSRTPYSINTKTSELNDIHYVRTLTTNPFLSSYDEAEALPEDILPTVITFQSAVPMFSDIKLRLHGIVFQQDKSSSYAIISMRGAIQEIYRVNQQITEGLFLSAITKKLIVVDYFGERYSLRIEDGASKQNVYNASEYTSGVTLTPSFNQQIEWLEVDKKRNPVRLFMIRRPYAVYSNGEFQGYKIMPGSNADQFKRLGFKSGDIITYLNGEEFTGPGMKAFVIQQLTHAQHIDLTVIRDNHELSINYGF